jgi:hypothetical protein
MEKVRECKYAKYVKRDLFYEALTLKGVYYLTPDNTRSGEYALLFAQSQVLKPTTTRD